MDLSISNYNVCLKNTIKTDYQLHFQKHNNYSHLPLN